MLDVLIDAAQWQRIDLEQLAARAFLETMECVGLAGQDVDVSLLACDDTRILQLNADFREKNTATNVLSWPTFDLSPELDGGVPTPPEPDMEGTLVLGDVAIAFETCEREAFELQKTLEAHTCHLIVHGTLHLLGYDHIRDRDATVMQALEIDILGKMGLDNPYRN